MASRKQHTARFQQARYQSQKGFVLLGVVMKVRAWVIPFLSFSLLACTATQTPERETPETLNYPVSIDALTSQKVNEIIENIVIPDSNLSHGELVGKVSESFLGTPYQAHTMIGDHSNHEVLVANFSGVDCFTLLDYVEALTRSHDQKSFLENLSQVRYIDGKVDYLKRRHFFTDWSATQPVNAIDITQSLTTRAKTAHKQLNRKDYCDCEEYIHGLGFVPRDVSYIATADIDSHVLNQLQTGDYIGIYSPLLGLDVTHVGIAIRKNGQVWFRNASSLSANMKVVDTPLIDYLQNKPGMVVLRAAVHVQHTP